ncbi:hypothetical protein ANCCAN_27932 [Ancylostoma caninum]|uniref:Secreted protein n=1 Tax=Ancylostoma caninum TaxID=29170 RepID=A0A368F2Q6_ANCCA|nr:hypothetical protein ANCCAN_27932 [Ancylostoma caninum]
MMSLLCYLAIVAVLKSKYSFVYSCIATVSPEDTMKLCFILSNISYSLVFPYHFSANNINNFWSVSITCQS